MRKKVSIVGSGNVGATAAQRIVDKELADVVLGGIGSGDHAGGIAGREVDQHEGDGRNDERDGSERQQAPEDVRLHQRASQEFQKYRRGAVRNSPRSSRRAASSVL